MFSKLDSRNLVNYLFEKVHLHNCRLQLSIMLCVVVWTMNSNHFFVVVKLKVHIDEISNITTLEKTEINMK